MAAHLKKSVWFIPNISSSITASDILRAFHQVSETGWDIDVTVKPYRKRGGGANDPLTGFFARVRFKFSSAGLTEKALVTMHQQISIPGSDFLVAFSLHPESAPFPPQGGIPRLVKGLPQGYTAGRLYDLLRPKTSVASIRVHVDFTSVWFNKEEDIVESVLLENGCKLTFHAYEPLTLFCAGLARGTDMAMLRNAFLDCEGIKDISIPRQNRGSAFAFVSFNTADQAFIAKKKVHGTTVNSRRISVQYREHKRAPVKEQKAESPDEAKETELLPSSEVPKAEVQQTQTTSDDCSRIKHIVVDGKVSDQWIEIWKNEAESSKAELVKTRGRVVVLEEQLQLLKEGRDKKLADIQRLNEQNTKLKKDLDVQMKAEDREKLQVEINDLKRRLELSESRRKILEMQADAPMWQEAKKKREAAERKVEAERKRKAELEESKRKMREIQETEARRKKEEEAAKKREKEKKEREEREEQERRQGKARKEQEWREATVKERARLKMMANNLWGLGKWSDRRALDRVQMLMDEFENIKFSESQPATFEVIPWPVLHDPLQLKVGQVDWAGVEAFFVTARAELEVAEYKKMVERLHKMFHPDRWRARAILKTVFDEFLRHALEEAGNTVSQAMTPLWRASKAL
ncbi:uncharacterized protein BT62DRAFT_967246 [Guyanagaster necrorhizus]|uniref:RRM domain-containing protein n=1 Tax=Guyanagaster necrorhizus TaxID=856835 RepID=A0A9P8ATD6_9AGAR|nr:uncharacterized protein BT62DRAFT_967246 [Guyanagaster necrorhizus MCA 3950]KAG7447304.1 hypothetical protein BT62DRAFT_967246 [Guyanagaster necrorhizus MCA 3950]